MFLIPRSFFIWSNKPESSLGRVGQLFDCWNNWSNSYWALPAPPPISWLASWVEEGNTKFFIASFLRTQWWIDSLGICLSAINQNPYSDNAAGSYCWSSFCGFCQQWFSWASSCLLRLIVWPLPNLWLFRWMGGWMPNRQTDQRLMDRWKDAWTTTYVLTKERFFILNLFSDTHVFVFVFVFIFVFLALGKPSSAKLDVFLHIV